MASSVHHRANSWLYFIVCWISAVTVVFVQFLPIVGSAPAPQLQREYVIRYRIPGASILHWNYYPSLNYNHKFSPLPQPPSVTAPVQDKLLPSQKQVTLTTTPPCTSTSTARTTTTSTTPTETTTSHKFGSQAQPNGDHTEEDEDISAFLEWAAQNPDPNKPTQQGETKPGDEDEYPVLETDNNEQSDFAILNVPMNNGKCPPGLQLINSTCRRGFGSRPRPRPRPRPNS